LLGFKGRMPKGGERRRTVPDRRDRGGSQVKVPTGGNRGFNLRSRGFNISGGGGIKARI